ncbi:ribonuclease MC-like [Gossypium australe]|uniref:Ribonuclease MC-like n=1 Tax=Gossypium australe TaxID=47621 RepID=A0A5B6WEN9_9ROSI|nr:ribonuclease MC-like [Gossypium australe]
MAVAVVCLSACFRLYSQLSSLNISTFIHHQVKAPDTLPTIRSYKLCLQWPPAACNGTLTCKPPIPPNFTIHGLWPPHCKKKPTPYNLSKILRPIEEELKSQWPNLIDGKNLTANYEFWKYEWEKHGPCSDYPDDPLTYFKSALKLRLDIKTIVRFERQESRTVQQVADEVFYNLNAYPQIVCNINPKSTQKQLWEIRLCYDRLNSGQPPYRLINCTKILTKGEKKNRCENLNDTIFYP